VRIWLFSDLHLRDAGANPDLVFASGIPDADICIVPGDVIAGDPTAGVWWLDRYVGAHMPVVMVHGNHEFYSSTESMERLRTLAGRAAVRTQGRVTVLDDMGLTLDGVRILGSTLWYNLEVFGTDPVTMANSARGAASLNDNRRIRRDDQTTARWEPADARRQHTLSRAWLEAELAASDLPTIVVTHHAPHSGSIAPIYRDDWSTAGFVSDLSHVIEQYQPLLWAHGHTHTSFDYSVGLTRIVCNPKGYGLENALGFNPALVINVADPKPRPRGVK
jgi:Icc-related predicted phosphoesterase